MTGILENTYFFASITFLLGILATVITTRILSKSKLLSYHVEHLPIGMTTEDADYGSIQVQWNGLPMPNLYLSSIELINRSVQDIENLELYISSNNAMLLTDVAEILGTTRKLEWTEDFKRRIGNGGGELTTEQSKLLTSQREYAVPVLNRNTKVRITYLSSSQDAVPEIALDVVHAGVRLEYREQQFQVFGVDISSAVLAGSVIGLATTVVLIVVLDGTWLVALLAYLTGQFVLYPGVAIVKLSRWIKGKFTR